MIIQFKAAPELGRLRVVSDDERKNQTLNSCGNCDLHSHRYNDLCLISSCGTINKINFVKVGV